MNRVVNELKSIYHQTHALFWGVFDSIALALVRPAPSQHSVLAIYTDRIGDFVLWFDSGSALCAHYRARGLSVTLLGNTAWAVWAKELGFVDGVWGIDPDRFKSSIPYRFNWLRKVRKAGFALVVHPIHSRSFMVGDAIVRASAAAERIGSKGDCVNSAAWLKRWGDRFYSKLIPAGSEKTMELVRHAEFVRQIGLPDFQARVPTLPASDVKLPIDASLRPYAVLFPTAGWVGRQWPAENFAEVGRRLTARGINVVIAGGPADHKPAKQIVDRMAGRVISLVGKTSLPELAALLRNAALVVANETSAVHIGAAVGARVLCITGGGHFGRFVPYVVEGPDPPFHAPTTAFRQMPCFNCDWRCIYPRKRKDAVRCIRDISTEEIWLKIESILHS